MNRIAVKYKYLPLMPMTCARARILCKEGKAKIKFDKKLNLHYVQLLVEPSGYDTQEISLGIDPGSTFDGVTILSKKCHHLNVELIHRPKKGKNSIKSFKVRQAINRRVIANCRKDYLHKITTQIANENKIIVLGDINSFNLAKNHKIAKSVYDAAWFLIKTLLGYKAIERGSVFLQEKENDSTRLCNICKVVDANSPKGYSGLKIREWQCNGCGTTHDRDVNASLNILSFGLERLANNHKSKKICA